MLKKKESERGDKSDTDVDKDADTKSDKYSEVASTVGMGDKLETFLFSEYSEKTIVLQTAADLTAHPRVPMLIETEYDDVITQLQTIADQRTINVHIVCPGVERLAGITNKHSSINNSSLVTPLQSRSGKIAEYDSRGGFFLKSFYNRYNESGDVKKSKNNSTNSSQTPVIRSLPSPADLQQDFK